MAIMQNVTIDGKKIARMNKRLKIVEEDLKNLHYNYAVEVARNMRKQVISQTKRAPRNKSANNIRAVRMSGRTTAIKMPLKLIYLDSMEPHYVSLKKGRAITRWARKYYDGSYKKTGRSNVKRTPKGNVSGYLYVTPDPFVNTAILNTDNWLLGEIDRILNKIK